MLGFRQNMNGGYKPPATFVGITLLALSSGSASLTLPAGAAIGDVAIVFTEYDNTSAGSNVTTSTGWAKSSRNWGYDASVHIKRLDATDITAGFVGLSNVQNGGVAAVMLYRGAAGATIKTDQGTTASDGPSLALTGFTKSAYCTGIVAVVSDRDTDVTITKPTGWNDRGGYSSPAPGFFCSRFSDLLVPASYTNGAAVTFTTMQGASNFYQHGYLIELT